MQQANVFQDSSSLIQQKIQNALMEFAQPELA